jgi:hypothetical protein
MIRVGPLPNGSRRPRRFASRRKPTTSAISMPAAPAAIGNSGADAAAVLVGSRTRSGRGTPLRRESVSPPRSATRGAARPRWAACSTAGEADRPDTRDRPSAEPRPIVPRVVCRCAVATDAVGTGAARVVSRMGGSAMTLAGGPAASRRTFPCGWTAPRATAGCRAGGGAVAGAGGCEAAGGAAGAATGEEGAAGVGLAAAGGTLLGADSRCGRKRSGSTYPWSSSLRRTPRWT